jgi:hypothetical protein
MNVRHCLTRLPDSIKQLILSEPTIKACHERGQPLENILSSSQWASSWIHHADVAERELLTRILIYYGGTPFTLDALLKTDIVNERLLGAEIRVAVARLRRSGILFASRKAWGDQLIYLPVDTVALWQPLLFPLQGKPLSEEASREITLLGRSYRLPLSLELFIAWRTVNDQPLSFTTKGALNRTSVTRMANKMRLTQDDLACLSLAYPNSEQVPAQVAFALDIGLYLEVIQREGNELYLYESGLKRWLSLTPIEANLKLYELVMTRYGSVDPVMHLLASATATLPNMGWFGEADLRALCNEEEKVIQWLSLLEAFGWVDRGTYRGENVFRINECLVWSYSSDVNDDNHIIIQPDGEVIVPPGVDLALRWGLEEMAERVAADQLFVYRLTRDACIKACNSGYNLQSIVVFLERHSSSGLPEPCKRALQDWFAQLSKVKFSEVVLLRTDSIEVAAALLADPITAEQLLEQIGDCDFIVEAAAIKGLKERMTRIGFPPLESTRMSMYASLETGETEEKGASAFSPQEEQLGWIYRRQALSLYEADHAIPSRDELFPGISKIPASWMTQSRAYHPSTSKEIIQRAIDWQVSIQLVLAGTLHSFIPSRLEEDASKWRVLGYIQHSNEFIAIHADERIELMIELPSLLEIESI